MTSRSAICWECRRCAFFQWLVAECWPQTLSRNSFKSRLWKNWSWPTAPVQRRRYFASSATTCPRLSLLDDGRVILGWTTISLLGDERLILGGALLSTINMWGIQSLIIVWWWLPSSGGYFLHCQRIYTSIDGCWRRSSLRDEDWTISTAPISYLSLAICHGSLTSFIITSSFHNEILEEVKGITMLYFDVCFNLLKWPLGIILIIWYMDASKYIACMTNRF